MPSTIRKVILFLLTMAVITGASSAFADDSAESVIRERFTTAIPGLEIKSVSATDLPSIYAVTTNDKDMLYATEKGDFFLVGELYSIDAQGVTNVTESGRAQEREKILAQVSADDMIQYKPEGDVKAVINVFTDIDCPYCRKLHQDVPRLNEMGIQVNYLAYPRSGPDTPSFDKYVSVFCADNNRKSMNDAKAGRQIPTRTCDNPVAEQFRLGSDVGVTGTPAIVLEDGHIVRGYVPAENLARGLGVL